jgi:hypothetical protein
VIKKKGAKHMSETKQNPLKEKSYAFALEIILTTRQMNENKEFVLAKQLLRSGTAIGALVEEANETHYWLRLLKDSNTLEAHRANNLIEFCRELEKLLTAIIKTTKSNLNKK